MISFRILTKWTEETAFPLRFDGFSAEGSLTTFNHTGGGGIVTGTCRTKVDFPRITVHVGNAPIDAWKALIVRGAKTVGSRVLRHAHLYRKKRNLVINK